MRLSFILDFLQHRAKGSTMYGFKGGPAGVMKCEYVELNTDFVYPYRNQVIQTFLMIFSHQYNAVTRLSVEKVCRSSSTV